tara:strand:- start:40 stop:708 length:669 start_codon:yes stop_codon:yes gene_type:complete
MKTFREFIAEVNYPEKGSDIEKERWNKVNARHQAMSDEDRKARIIGSLGRDKDGHQRYGFKSSESRKRQQVTRKDSSSDQTDPKVKKKDYNKAVKNITDKGLEAHHNVPLNRARQLFKGKTPEQQQAIRDKHAEYGTYFGNDPRNLSGLSAKAHRGEGGAHRQLDAMDKSIKKAGKKSDSIFGKIKSVVRQSRKQQNKNNQTPEAEHSDIVNHNKKLKKEGA